MLTLLRGELTDVRPDYHPGCATGADFDWRPGQAANLLLAGDETAVPAICDILASLPEETHAWAFLEVPTVADCLELRLPAGCEVRWLAREDAIHGACLEAAVREWAGAHRALVSSAMLSDIPPLGDLDFASKRLWDLPRSGGRDFYAWLAGEAALMERLRRFLVFETGADLSRVACLSHCHVGNQ